MAVTAPRILKAPIGCRFSGLSQSPGQGEASSGVRTAYGPDQFRGVADQVDVDQLQCHLLSSAGSG